MVPLAVLDCNYTSLYHSMVNVWTGLINTILFKHLMKKQSIIDEKWIGIAYG